MGLDKLSFPQKFPFNHTDPALRFRMHRVTSKHLRPDAGAAPFCWSSGICTHRGRFLKLTATPHCLWRWANKQPVAITSIFNRCYFNWTFPGDRHGGKSTWQHRLLALGPSTRLAVSIPGLPLLSSPLSWPGCSLVLSISPSSGLLPALHRAAENTGYVPGGRKTQSKNPARGPWLGKRPDGWVCASSSALSEIVRRQQLKKWTSSSYSKKVRGWRDSPVV